MDMVNGMLAGATEGVLCQTPNQVIAIKMIHDASPRGPRRYKGLIHAVATMWRENGFLGFYQGVVPAVVKGAATNLIRFPVYGMLKRIVQGSDRDSAGAVPLTPMQSMLCGGTAGAISAVFTQPIDTVKANMMGLDAGRFRSSFGCAAELIRAGGPLVLMNGVGPRVCRVFIEVREGRIPPHRMPLASNAIPFTPLLLLTCFHRPVHPHRPAQVGLQFSLFESVGRLIDRTLHPEG